MTSKRLGCAIVTQGNLIQGIITDGDLRRMIKNNTSIEGLQAKDIMSANPKRVAETEYAVKALHLMRQNSITQLIVVDSDDHYLGVLHIHDILREGIL